MASIGATQTGGQEGEKLAVLTHLDQRGQGVESPPSSAGASPLECLRAHPTLPAAPRALSIALGAWRQPM